MANGTDSLVDSVETAAAKKCPKNRAIREEVIQEMHVRILELDLELDEPAMEKLAVKICRYIRKANERYPSTDVCQAHPLTSRENPPEKEAYRRELRDSLTRLLRYLPYNYRPHYIKLLYGFDGEELGPREIARLYRRHPERIRMAHDKAIAKLRRLMACRRRSSLP